MFQRYIWSLTMVAYQLKHNFACQGYIILSEKTKTGEDGKQETIDM